MLTGKMMKEFYAQLVDGAVEFAYRKRNGELRIATGTLYKNLIPVSDQPKGIRKAPKSIKPYWDLFVYEWRSFDPNELVWVWGIYEDLDNLSPEEREMIEEYKQDELARIANEMGED